MSKMQTFIAEQPAALRRTLDVSFDHDALRFAFQSRVIRKVWILGSGTSLFAAMIAATDWERVLGIDVEAISSLEFADVPDHLLGAGTAVVGISQSGASFILVEGLTRARRAGSLTIGVTAEPAALIGAAADFLLPTATGPEDALGKTKGFLTTAFAACWLGCWIKSSDAVPAAYADFPDAVARVIADVEQAVTQWTERFASLQSVFAIGSGALLPAAWEGGLKVLEVAKQVVVTKELEEMLHGPFNAVGPSSGFILLAGHVERRDRLDAFLKAVAVLDLPLLAIADARTEIAPSSNTLVYQLPALQEPALEAILAVVPLQILADRLATARGLDPDVSRYPFLYKVLAAKSIYV